jgi:hypothetical protein
MKYDDYSQASSRGGNGATSDFQAIAELKLHTNKFKLKFIN